MEAQIPWLFGLKNRTGHPDQMKGPRRHIGSASLFHLQAQSPPQIFLCDRIAEDVCPDSVALDPRDGLTRGRG